MTLLLSIIITILFVLILVLALRLRALHTRDANERTLFCPSCGDIPKTDTYFGSYLRFHRACGQAVYRRCGAHATVENS